MKQMKKENKAAPERIKNRYFNHSIAITNEEAEATPKRTNATSDKNVKKVQTLKDVNKLLENWKTSSLMR